MRNISNLLLTFFAVCLALNADSGLSLTGVVRDPQSAAIPDATVSLFAQSAGAGWNATTDIRGAWGLDQLPPGEYILRIEAPGFATYVSKPIRLHTAPQAPMDVTLQVAAVRDEVIVTAMGAPQTSEEITRATTVIENSDADNRDSAALTGAIDLTPGLRVQQLGGPGAYSTIQINGMRPEDTAILVDGLRLRDVSGTQADASGLIEDLLLTDSDRVEVLRGSGSSLYGTNAIGGVVNVITDQGGGKTRGSLLLEGGSLDYGRARGQIAGGLRHDTIDYSAGLSQIYVANGVGGDSPFRDTSLQSRVTFHLTPAMQLAFRIFGGNSFGKVLGNPDVVGNPSGEGILNAVPLSLSQSNISTATFLPAPDNPDSTRAARYITGAVILTGQPTNKLNYSVSYQIVSNSRRYGDGPAGVGYQPLGSTRSLYDGRIQTANATVEYYAGAHDVLSGGYEFETENYANDYVDFTNPAAASATNATQSSHAVFVQDRIRLFGDRLQISGAFRSQFFSLDTPQLLPAASAPYQGISFAAPAPAYTGDGSIAWYFRRSGTKLRAHTGTGYRAPSLFERFGTGFDPVFGYTVYGDPRLTPEHSIEGDAGIDQTFAHDRIKASVSWFYTALRNQIVFDTTGLINPATDPFGRFIGYVNVPGGISRGVESSLSASPVRSLNVTATYTFVNAIERTPIVSDVLQTFVIPRNQFSIVATERASSRLLLTFDTLASGDYLAPIYGTSVTQVFRFGGIHRINAGASYQLPFIGEKPLRLFIRGENLSGQNYFESGFPTAGRTARAGLQLEF